MADPMAGILGRDLEYESLLDCCYALGAPDRQVFQLLVEADKPFTVADLAEEIDRKRTTAYRAPQRLREAGMVEQNQRSSEPDGYYHVFSPTDPNEIADDMQRLLTDRYAMIGQPIAPFRERHGDVADDVETGDKPATPPTLQ